MRELIIEKIQNYGHKDWSYAQGDENAYDYPNYKAWLISLSDDLLLEALMRVAINVK